MENSPLLEQGAEYVLFLRSGGEADEAFSMQGGPLGRLLVEDGKASSLSAIHDELSDLPDLGISGRPVAEVLEEASDHAGDARPDVGAGPASE